MLRMQLGHLPLGCVALSEPLNTLLVRRFKQTIAKDVSSHLSDYFPNAFVAALYELQFIFNKTQVNAYLIGGLTRDMVLSGERQFEIRDVDITIEGHVDALVSELLDVSKNFKAIEQYPQFGTAKMLYKDKIEFDFASTRKEVYMAVGALPEVSKLAVTLAEDTVRRDFTINALALSINNLGQIADCFGGLEDLQQKQLRPLKACSFFEDPSRVYRLLKFMGRLQCMPSEDTMYLLTQFMRHLPSYKGGGERIKKELKAVLDLPEGKNKISVLELFTEYGLHRLMDRQLPMTIDWPLPFDVIGPRIIKLKEQFEDYWEPNTTFLIYLGLMFSSFSPEEQTHAIERLGLNRQEKDSIEEINQLTLENTISSLSYNAKDSNIDRVIAPLEFASVAAGCVLSTQFEACSEALWRYKTQLEGLKCELTGLDIMALGVPEGQQIKQLLHQLKGAKLDEKLEGRWEEMQWLEARIKQGLDTL